MSFTIHIPHWLPWVFACVGSFVAGWFASIAHGNIYFGRAVGRMFGWY